MPQLYNDVLLGTTFLLILIVMLTVGRPVFKHCQRAFKQIILGLSFFIGFSLIHILANNNVFSGIVFLQEKANANAIEATLIVGGLISLLVGVGGWLPSLKYSRIERARINKRYYCLKMINQMITSAKSYDEAFEKINKCLSTYLGISRCAGFKYYSKQNALYLSSAIGFNSDKPNALRRIDLSNTDLKSILDTKRPSYETLDNQIFNYCRQPDLWVPISNDGSLYGALFCWSDDIKDDDDYLDFFSVIASQMGRHCANLINVETSEHFRKQNESFERLSKLCSRVSSIQQITKPLFSHMRNLINAEFMTIADLDNSGENMFRYSIGASGRMLLEKRVSRATEGTDVEKVFKDGRPILKPKVADETKFTGEDGLFLSCGMRSKIVLPIRIGKRVLGAVVFGHSQPGYYSSLHLKKVQEVIQVVSSVFEKERLNEIIETKEEQMIRLQLIERNLVSENSLQSFFSDACDILTKRMKCTMARISLIDSDNKNLLSQSWQTIRNTGQEVNKSESIPLSLLPWHRIMVEADKPMLINQADLDSQMQSQESSQTLLPNIKSAMLIPIKLGDKVKGVISIGEVRNWNRRTFNAADLVLAKDIAAKCSVALRLRQLELEKNQIKKSRTAFAVPTSEAINTFRTDIKSPLTSIMGATELLKTKSGAEDKTASRYYNLIMKSAEKIQQMTERESWEDYNYRTTNQDEVVSEQVIG
ncbi:MAG: GAF domain-containing protein [candidate division Zixibacteria bacterium]|nr:GAF domain-containing protein [candidate division Zixibacteria bacterium]